MAANNGGRKTEIQFSSACTTLSFNFLLLVANVLYVPISAFLSTTCNLLFITVVADLAGRISTETLLLFMKDFLTSTTWPFRQCYNRIFVLILCHVHTSGLILAFNLKID